MADLSKNGNGVPASATRFSHLGEGVYGMLPIAWASLMHGERTIKVFWALCAHANTNGTSFPSVKTIARLCGIHDSHVPPALRKLEAIGAIQTVRIAGRSSHYRVMPPPIYEVVSNSDTTQLKVVSESDRGVVSESDRGVVSDSDTHNRPRNRVFNKTSRARARDDGQEKTNDDESRRTAFDAEENERKTTLRQPTDGEARVLAVCYQWQRGVSMPMPADLVELYRTMRPVHDLPQRPGA